ncbi:MAG: orotidine-5'-phosphate decarboxylase [Candidatus Omnitrophota bacterium]|nr:orotidine-5'-phosphate decarboxylase [Candidatus Omnitrophota bacterium]
MTSRDRLIIALDAPSWPQTQAAARALRGLVKTVKVGSILFTACGPAVVQRLRAFGFHVMLDLKFFDIPNTVEESCRAAVRHKVSMLTVHAAGHPEMLRAAVRGVRAEARRCGVRRPLVLGVTVLTSVSAGRSAQVRSDVMRLAGAAQRAGCDGVVASAHEAAALRRRFGRRLQIVCPGIRPRQSGEHDQRRVATPREAVAAGADFLVVGRPITAARDPRASAKTLLRDMEDHGAC